MNKLLKKILLVFVTAALLAGEFAPFVKTASADNTPASFSVDITSDCVGTPEDIQAPDPGNVFPPGYVIDPSKGEWPPLLPAPIPTVTLPAGHIDWKVNSFAEFMSTMGFVNSGTSIVPTLSLRSGTFSANEGDPVELQAVAQNFKTPLQAIQYAWWEVRKNGNKEEHVSLNGVVAGGEPFGENDTPINDNGRCGLMTRKPKVDADNDGMDDQWERRYTNDPGGLKAGDDLDQDGYVEDRFQQNETGTKYRIVSNARSKNGTNFVTGDGKYTNLEEYIWGTNPLDADTDDDGFPDEADVAGVGQDHLVYQPNEVAGVNQSIEVDAIGESTLAGKDENLVTQMLGFRLNLPTLLLQNFSVLLGSNNATPQLGKPFQVQVQPNGTSAKPGNLQYNWKITSNNVTIPVNTAGSPCHLVAYGDIVECTFTPANATPGNKITFYVDVFDTNLGVRANNTLNVTVGGSVLLSSNPSVVPQYPIDQTGEHPVAPQGDQATGERWVEITATLAQGNYSDYNFDWYVDETKITDTCATSPLVFTGKAEPQGMVLCGVGSYILYYHATGGNTHTYKVNAKITDKRSGEFLADEQLPLYTDPTPTPYPGQSSGSSSSLIQTQAEVQPNSQIVLRAANLEASENHTYQYIWTVDGQVVSDSDQRVVTFTAQPDKKEYQVQLQIVEKNNNTIIGQKVATTSVAVAPHDKFQDWKDSRLASVKSALYPFYHSMAGNTSVFFVIAGVVLVCGVYLSQNKKNSHA